MASYNKILAYNLNRWVGWWSLNLARSEEEEMLACTPLLVRPYSWCIVLLNFIFHVEIYKSLQILSQMIWRVRTNLTPLWAIIIKQNINSCSEIECDWKIWSNLQLQPNLRPIRGLFYLRSTIWEEIKRDLALGHSDIISNCGNVIVWSVIIFMFIAHFPCLLLASMAALYLPFVTHRHFRIWTQCVTFKTWDPQTFDQSDVLIKKQIDE